MSRSIGFFDDAARVGSNILNALDSGQVSDQVKNYMERAAEIYRLLVKVHGELADVAVRVSLAKDLSEARQVLESIQHTSLESTFRARKWCNEFERLGEQLQPLGSQIGLPPDDANIWDEFCYHLRMSEGEVALLYEDKLYDFRQLKDTVDSLEQLKVRVATISDQLVTQKANFDLLAKKAEAMRERVG